MDAEFAAISAGSSLDRALASQRRRMVDAFMLFREDRVGESVLEVGIVPVPGTEQIHAAGGLADRTGVTSCVIASSAWRRPTHAELRRPVVPSVPHHPVDSRHLPFADGEFDWAFCSEVIEHAGGFERQYELLKELLRVSRKGIFVTTPNRWHPMEFNTRLPFLHWLPDAAWRRILKWSGKGAWASESVLNLLDAHEIKNLTSLLPCSPKSEIGHLRVLGIKAHFFLQIRKNSSARVEKKTTDKK
jgi:hypothetical protein